MSLKFQAHITFGNWCLKRRYKKWKKCPVYGYYITIKFDTEKAFVKVKIITLFIQIFERTCDPLLLLEELLIYKQWEI